MDVLKLEDILVSNKATEEEKLKENDEEDSSSSDSETELRKRKKNLPLVIRGKPVSGRFWKETKTRASSIIKTGGIRLSKEKKDLLRIELKRAKELTNERKEQKKREKEERRRRRRMNIKRQKENELKSEIVQVIKNPAKIKRMKKKQLRRIAKRDTTVVSKD